MRRIGALLYVEKYMIALICLYAKKCMILHKFSLTNLYTKSRMIKAKKYSVYIIQMEIHEPNVPNVTRTLTVGDSANRKS